MYKNIIKFINQTHQDHHQFYCEHPQDHKIHQTVPIVKIHSICSVHIVQPIQNSLEHKVVPRSPSTNTIQQHPLYVQKVRSQENHVLPVHDYVKRAEDRSVVISKLRSSDNY